MTRQVNFVCDTQIVTEASKMWLFSVRWNDFICKTMSAFENWFVIYFQIFFYSPFVQIKRSISFLFSIFSSLCSCGFVEDRKKANLFFGGQKKSVEQDFCILIQSIFLFIFSCPAG